MVKGNKMKLPSNKLISDQFDLIFNEMDKMGYINYEISSFCKNGFESKHNSKYWSNEKYIGYGQEHIRMIKSLGIGILKIIQNM